MNESLRKAFNFQFSIFIFQFPQFFVDALDGEAHDVVVGALDAGYADVAYPFLDAVGSGFVHWVELSDVMPDFFVGESLEGYVGAYTATCHLAIVENTIAGIYLMRLA